MFSLFGVLSGARNLDDRPGLMVTVAVGKKMRPRREGVRENRGADD